MWYSLRNWREKVYISFGYWEINPHFSQKDPSRGKTQQSHKEKLMIAGLTIFTNPLIFILFCLLNVSILFCFALLCFYFAFSFVHFVMCFCLILRFFCFLCFICLLLYCLPSTAVGQQNCNRKHVIKLE